MFTLKKTSQEWGAENGGYIISGGKEFHCEECESMTYNAWLHRKVGKSFWITASNAKAVCDTKPLPLDNRTDGLSECDCPSMMWPRSGIAYTLKLYWWRGATRTRLPTQILHHSKLSTAEVVDFFPLTHDPCEDVSDLCRDGWCVAPASFSEGAKVYDLAVSGNLIVRMILWDRG